MSDKRIKWHVEVRQVSDLKPYNKNPRIITKEGLAQLKKSFDEIGFAQPININLDGTILSGHARFQQLKSEGVSEVECYVPDRKLTPKQEEAVIIRMNKNIAGEFDFEMLANEFEIDDLLEWGFSADELALPEIESIEGQCDEDDVPEAPPTPKTVRGDVYELGNHRVMCGDSTMIDDVEKLMNGEKADMVFTDPPYGIKESGDRKKRNTKNTLRVGVEYKSFKDDSTSYAIDAYNVCEVLGIEVQIWFGANYFCHSLPQTNNWLVWDKRIEDKQRDLNSDAELAYVKSGKNSVRIFRHLWKGLIKASEHGQARVHPTQKPIALAEWCFGEYNKEGKSVLDLFLGSGSTLIACEKTNRKCYGMELDEHYCDVIVSRYVKFTGNNKIKRNGEEIEWNIGDSK